MSSDFMLPHGIVSPPIESVFNASLILVGVPCLIAICYLCLRIAKQNGKNKLSKYKQEVLVKLTTILNMDNSKTLSQQQAYLLWRLIRKTGYYYFGDTYLKVSIRDSISMSVNTSSDITSNALFEFFYELNQAVYNPHKKVDKTNIKKLISDWLYDQKALTMNSVE